MSVRVEHGDCRDVIKTMADASIHAVVTDPPYSLVSIQKRFGKPGQAPAAEGVYRRSAAGFMGKQWDTGETAFDPAFWAEVLRVLKPGGHLVAFGGTRTYHRLACAIEDGGFEIRDQIGWAFGSGFPKSHDVSKGIDKAAGARGHDSTRFNAVGQQGERTTGGDVFRSDHPDYVKPRGITYAARQWQGWGTALKPAWESICLARKPLGEKTVAANVLRWGTGALNIDACRIIAGGQNLEEPIFQGGARSNRADSKACTCPSREASHEHHTAGNGNPASLAAEYGPHNGLLPNGSECAPADQSLRRSRDGYLICPHCGGELAHAGVTAGQASSRQQPDARNALGLCEEGGYSREDLSNSLNNNTTRDVQRQGRWPANLIHDGSEEVLAAFPHTESGLPGNVKPTPSTLHAYGEYQERSLVGHIDAGSAARFFYSAKADAADRLGSKHPTVKPVDLMAYLCRLVTPVGGTVLDPFAGSGSTGMACMREGFDCILIEREREYYEDILNRIAHVDGSDTPLFAEVAAE